MWILRQELLKYSRLTFTFILVRKWRRSNKSDPVSLASRLLRAWRFFAGTTFSHDVTFRATGFPFEEILFERFRSLFKNFT